MGQHIGIVAVSAEGAALCYRTICSEGAAQFGRHNHPEITMHTLPLATYMRPIEAGDWAAVGEMLLTSVDNVRNAGADFVICPDNTAHQAVDLIRERSSLPWLHIADEVAAVAAHAGYDKLMVLGTRYLMEGPVYPRALQERGIDYCVPEPVDRKRMNELIFDELVYGRLLDATRTYVSTLIESGRSRGADAVVLGCTEIPLLIGAADSVLPVLDSTRILARAALRAASGVALAMITLAQATVSCLARSTILEGIWI
jgi:aspartate racemase